MNGREVIGLDTGIFASFGPERTPVWPISFSADGTVIAYPLVNAKATRGRVVVDGRRGPEYDVVGRPALSADGRVVAYRAQRDDECFIRINDREEPAWDYVSDPAVSRDGSVVAYAGSRNGRWFLVVGGTETPLSGRPSSVFLGADGRRAGWIELETAPDGGSKMRVVAGEERGEPFGIVGRPEFSPTESLVAYAADEGSKRFVVIGTKKFETLHRVGDPVFSPDGRQVGYGARIGREIRWKVLDVPSPNR